MRRVLIAISVMFALSWPLSASGQERVDNIGSMRSACLVLLGTPGSLAESSFCAGWIMGETNWRLAACAAHLEHGPSLFTAVTARYTEGHSYKALAQAFVNRANANPQHWSDNLGSLTLYDVFSEFPCEKPDD